MKLALNIRLSHNNVTGFYPYTSVVQNRILEENNNSIGDLPLNRLFDDYMTVAVQLGCIKDNKVVIEITNILTKQKLYIGKYDGTVSLGMSVYQHDVSKQYTKHFDTIEANIISTLEEAQQSAKVCSGENAPNLAILHSSNVVKMRNEFLMNVSYNGYKSHKDIIIVLKYMQQFIDRIIKK